MTSAHPRSVRLAAAASALPLLALVGCAAPAATAPGAYDEWDQVLADAKGQTVQLWMYGGDDQGNAYVDDILAPAVAEYGVTLERVPVTDTRDALNRVFTELQAGRSDGTVDLIWVNGDNFRTGREADAWLCGWTDLLPSMANTDPADPLLESDFGTPVDGCEAPWHKAQFTLVYDADTVTEPPTTMAEVLDWAEANPGRFTYPAPPDFTGSVFVREVLASVSGGADEVPATFSQAAFDELSPALYDRLSELAPSLWRGGDTYPANEAELGQLFADGQVDMTMTYGPATLTDLVADGTYPQGRPCCRSRTALWEMRASSASRSTPTPQPARWSSRTSHCRSNSRSRRRSPTSGDSSPSWTSTGWMPQTDHCSTHCRSRPSCRRSTSSRGTRTASCPPNGCPHWMRAGARTC